MLLAGETRTQQEKRGGGNLRLDLATVTGSTLPGQESQGAVSGSLELAVLFE